MRRTVVALLFLAFCIMGLALMRLLPAWAGPFPKDTIFVAVTNTADRTVIYTSTDKEIKEFAKLPPGQDAEGDPWLCPMAFSASGDLYVVSRGNGDNVGALWKITKGGDFTSDKPVAMGLYPDGGSKKYCGLAFDQAGNAYIANSQDDMKPIVKVDPAGQMSKLTGEFDRPHGLVVVGDTLYIGESATGRVLAYNLKDNTVKPFATGFPPGSDHMCAQLAVDPRGHVLVLWRTDPDDENTPGLFDIAAGGDFTGKAPVAKGTFRCDVNQIAVDSNNNVYAAGNGSSRTWISRFSGGSFADFVELNGEDVGDSEAIAIAP